MDQGLASAPAWLRPCEWKSGGGGVRRGLDGVPGEEGCGRARRVGVDAQRQPVLLGVCPRRDSVLSPDVRCVYSC